MKARGISRTFSQHFLMATLAIVVAYGSTPRAVQAGYIVTLQQVGSNVVATGSGSLDLTGLTFITTGLAVSQMTPSTATILTGPTVPGNIDGYTGLTGPTNFGSGGFLNSTSGSGDFVGVSGSIADLFVPHGYVSGTALSDTSTYNSATFTSLGVTPGTYEWSWGTGPNQNFTLQIGSAAVPDSGSTFGLLLVAGTGLFGLSRLRARQSA